MECPACQYQMSLVTIGNISIDACVGGCGGLWFDQLELKKFDEPPETNGEKLLDIKKKLALKIDSKQKRLCPVCKNVTMMKHFFSIKRKIEVDECANCGGIFLDGGELAEVRRLFKSEKEKIKLSQKYFSEQFDSQLDAMVREAKENAEKAKKFARLFRFVCPSYYIPGKQDWGAF